MVEEVVKTLNLFLAHRTFKERMGGTPAAGGPVRGAARDRQDLHGQGHGARGGRAVPVRVVVGVPVDVLRPDQPQDPLLFQGAARATPAGRAAPSASSRRSTPSAPPGPAWAPGGGREGIAGVVNELLIQLQSFDQPPAGTPAAGRAGRRRQPLAARATASCASRAPTPANILVVGATNRAADLDPALLRPGRFDRTITSTCPTGPGGARSSTTTWPARPTAPSSTGPARRDALAGADVRLFAGDARAPARRGAGLGPAPGGRPPRPGTTSSRPR